MYFTFALCSCFLDTKNPRYYQVTLTTKKVDWRWTLSHGPPSHVDGATWGFLHKPLPNSAWMCSSSKQLEIYLMYTQSKNYKHLNLCCLDFFRFSDYHFWLINCLWVKKQITLSCWIKPKTMSFLKCEDLLWFLFKHFLWYLTTISFFEMLPK
jgi:hypothetical protein